MTESIGGGGMEEMDTADWKVCECCNQKIPPKTSRLFLATHRVDTPGLPSSFNLKAEHAVAVAEQRAAGGHVSALWVCSPGKPFTFWRSYPD